MGYLIEADFAFWYSYILLLSLVLLKPGLDPDSAYLHVQLCVLDVNACKSLKVLDIIIVIYLKIDDIHNDILMYSCMDVIGIQGLV